MMLAFAIAGAAVALLHSVNMLRRGINTEQFVIMVKKLLAAGNLERGAKLCRAAAIAPVGRVAEAILTAAVAPGRQDDDPVMVRRALDSASRVRMAEEERKLRRLLPGELLGAALLIVPVALVGASSVRPAPAAVILTCAGWFLLLVAVVKRRRMMRELAGVAEELVDATTEAIRVTAKAATTSSSSA